jgi:hypothetical protein
MKTIFLAIAVIFISPVFGQAGDTSNKAISAYFNSRYKNAFAYLDKECLEGISFIKFKISGDGKITSVVCNDATPSLIDSFLKSTCRTMPLPTTVLKKLKYRTVILPVYYSFNYACQNYGSPEFMLKQIENKNFHFIWDDLKTYTRFNGMLLGFQPVILLPSVLLDQNIVIDER